MKDLFRDIFEYHYHFNNLLIDQLAIHETALPKRTFPLFCHLLNAGHIWNSRILLQPAPGIHDFHSIDQCRKINATIFKDVQIILQQVDLNKIVHYRNTKEKHYANTARDILFHAANHATHHKGQIISDFRLSGIEPLITDYIYYKRQQGTTLIFPTL